jgi:penicillin-binding protein 2
VIASWRQTTVGALVTAMMVILLLRLWFLQVTDVEDSLEVAAAQQIRTVSIEAPRGDIFDRDGRFLMAGTIASMRVIVDRQLISLEEEESVLIPNLATLLAMPAAEIIAEFEARGSGARFPIGDEVSSSTALFVLENIDHFPGVSVEPVPVRVYPLIETAAHVIGYIGAPGASDIDRGASPGDRVGKFGLERYYEDYLAGTPGAISYRVNARGDILGILEERPPEPGGSLITTLDLTLQRVTEETLMQAIQLARQEGETEVIRAAAVVMDVTDGSVLAMASVPAFDPSLFSTGSISVDAWEAMQEKAVQNNFAIQGSYPPGSSFKTIVYALARQFSIAPVHEEEHEDAVDPADPTSYFCDGQLEFEATPLLNDWKAGGHGLIDLGESLHQSCNLYYWSIALRIWEQRAELGEDRLQEWARLLGFGSRTGIDLPFESEGLVPDRTWFQRHQQQQTGVVRPEGGWAAGDVMNIATGQGALIVTPLQMAVAYAALVNGGTVWEPRVVQSVRDSQNNIIHVHVPDVRETIDISEETIADLKRDLNGVVNSTFGTARRAFEGFCDTGVRDSECAALKEVGGKTGTAEIRQAVGEDDPDIDTAWFVGVAPLSSPKYVVAVVIDQGGSGGLVAAPAARRIFQYLLGETPDPLRRGDDTER